MFMSPTIFSAPFQTNEGFFCHQRTFQHPSAIQSAPVSPADDPIWLAQARKRIRRKNLKPSPFKCHRIKRLHILTQLPRFYYLFGFLWFQLRWFLRVFFWFFLGYLHWFLQFFVPRCFPWTVTPIQVDVGWFGGCWVVTNCGDEFSAACGFC